MKKELQQTYKEREKQNQAIIESLEEKNSRYSWARGLVFVSGLILVIWLAYVYWPFAIFVFFIAALVFVRLLRKNIKLKQQLAYHRELLRININEQQALIWKYNDFENGEEYTVADKSFLFDLDVFGEGSLFQFLNRSATKSGEHVLADLFIHQEKDKEEIESRQLSVVELMPMLDWRQDFQADGKINKETINDWDNLKDWLFANQFFHSLKGIKTFVKLVPYFSLLFIGLAAISIIPSSLLIVYMLATLSLVGARLLYLNKEHQRVSKMLPLARKYAVLLKKIEDADFKCTRLGKHQYSLRKEKITASQKVGELASLIHSLDNRNNMIMGILLNAFLLWDYKYMLKLEKWRLQNKDNFDHWVRVISEFDAFSSLANFAYNNPHFVFPDISENFQLEMKDTGHPLIPDNVRINNDLSVSNKANFFIITGANMAGKSTFLRTVGVNMLLALTGAPVCASYFKLKPVDVYTSMRTSDSLQKNESYFFAELSRLQTLINRLREGKQLFIILDEVLKGTNSKDKRLGSFALLRQLIGLKTTGIIATHDVSLGDLEKEFPDNVSNRRFEVEINNDELIFDYKLKEGISQNLNATFLMKKMGITI